MNREQAIQELVSVAEMVAHRLMELSQTGRRITRDDIQVFDLYQAVERVKRSSESIPPVAPSRRGRRTQK